MYVLGKKHGKGEQIRADGSSYDGHWVEDKRQGYGKFIWNDKRTYEG